MSGLNPNRYLNDPKEIFSCAKNMFETLEITYRKRLFERVNKKEDGIDATHFILYYGNHNENFFSYSCFVNNIGTIYGENIKLSLIKSENEMHIEQRVDFILGEFLKRNGKEDNDPYIEIDWNSKYDWVESKALSQ